MPHWLLKTEPESYSWQDLRRERRTVWDGISNPLALKNMRAASRGDEVIIYHTGRERRAMGLARITRPAYPDPKLDDPRRLVINISAGKPLAEPVTLVNIKTDPAFRGWDLLRLSRLSFVPVPSDMWRRLLEISGTT